jgi:molybdopterin synthase sulfur carrier subunit
MAVKVRIPTPLQKLTNNQSEVQCEAKNIDELLASLEKQYPGVKERICDADGKLRRFVNVYVNEEDIRFLNGQDTALKTGDDISIIPAIAGGSGHPSGPGQAAHSKTRVTLVFPQNLIQEPVVFTMAKKFNVIPNIRKARVTETVGEMTLELEGEAKDLDQGIKYLESRGVKVEPVTGESAL